jgi:glycerophosphoryl diester phosphodiesterase
VSRADERSTRLSPWLRRPGERPFVLGHRGARHAAPENTMMAFDLALSEGADGIELDVRLDGDDRVIVLHDRTLERVSEGRESRTAETLTAAELAKVDVGRGERTPLLADVITWARERTARVNVELKRDVAKPWALIEGVVRAARAAGNSEELLLFSSFHPAFVATLAVLLPNHARAWLVHEKQRVLGRAPGYRLLGADGVHPQHSLITQRTLARWKRQPALVNAWTVNAGDEARRLAALGVDGIVSDNPGTILQALSEAG